MIRLLDLLFEKKDVEERSVWRTYFNKWGARNSIGQRRYFDNQEDAAKFARGEIKGHHPGWPEKKLKPEPKVKKQGYDHTPVTKRDMEKES